MNGKSNGFVKALCNHVSVIASRIIKAAHSVRSFLYHLSQSKPRSFTFLDIFYMTPISSHLDPALGRRTGMKNFNAVSHNRARPYFRIKHGRGEVRARQVYLNVHSVTGNVVDTE